MSTLIQSEFDNFAIHVVEQCPRLRAEISRAIFQIGCHCEIYSDASELIEYKPRSGIIFIRDGICDHRVANFIGDFIRMGIWLPVIAMDIAPQTDRVVEAIKGGALDYITLPLDPVSFAGTLDCVKQVADSLAQSRRRVLEARQLLETLSVREREVLNLLTLGSCNKDIARQLEISPRTVEIHRANMMSKLRARHAAEAVRIKIEADVLLAA
ncbi:MAG: response regulator transcription factor [Erythrobacter sp.]